MAPSNSGDQSAKKIWLACQHGCRYLITWMSGRAFLGFASCIILTFASISVSYADKDNSIIVIANKSIAEKTLTLGAVRSIFGMRLRSWKGGIPIRVFVFNDYHPLHIEFSKKVLGVFPHQLRWSWDRLVFSGTGQAPTYVKTVAQMLEDVENTPGAIGYINGSQDHALVKVLPVVKD